MRRATCDVPRASVVGALLLIAGVLAGCASTAATPRPFPLPGRADAPASATDREPPPVGGGDVYALTGTALGLRGAPYRNGGTDPSGFDCSGFVWYVFSRHGMALPRTVDEQYQSGAPAGTPLQPGDLVFFSTIAPGPTHVGILIGGDEFVHAPSSAGVVRVERISAPYWSSRFVGARRPFGTVAVSH